MKAKKQFESFAKDHGFNTEVFSDGTYIDPNTRNMWVAWRLSRLVLVGLVPSKTDAGDYSESDIDDYCQPVFTAIGLDEIKLPTIGA